MSTSHDEQNPIRLYLLGKPDERGRDEFEQRLFADDEFLEEVMAAEDQLIDDFLTGDLTPNEVAMFEKNFLVTDERRQKLRLGKTLRTYAKQASVPVAKAKPSPARWSWRQWFSPSILDHPLLDLACVQKHLSLIVCFGLPPTGCQGQEVVDQCLHNGVSRPSPAQA